MSCPGEGLISLKIPDVSGCLGPLLPDIRSTQSWYPELHLEDPRQTEMVREKENVEVVLDFLNKEMCLGAVVCRRQLWPNLE